MEWNSIVPLICISLLTKETEYLFYVFTGLLYFFSVDCILYLAHFLIGNLVGFFFLLFFRRYIFTILVLLVIMQWKSWIYLFIIIILKCYMSLGNSTVECLLHPMENFSLRSQHKSSWFWSHRLFLKWPIWKSFSSLQLSFTLSLWNHLLYRS